jgi:hypothetical protein
MCHSLAKGVSMVVIWHCLSSSAFATVILSSEPSLNNLVPKDAFDGVGAWNDEHYFIATGHSIEVDSLGVTKGKRTEQTIAEDDSKARIAAEAARNKIPDFDPEMFDLVADISDFRVAATYRIEGRVGLFLIGMTERRKIKVKADFNPKKARAFAFNLFHAGQFKDAATRLAILTQRDIQDAETMAHARAASWHMNLQSGISGDARRVALQGLGGFYFDRQEYESSLKYSYDLYKETENPSRELLGTLVKLCEKTNRDNSAKAFLHELNQRYPSPK